MKLFEAHFSSRQMVCIALLVLAVTSGGGGAVVSAQTVMGGGMLSCGEWRRLRSFEGREGNFKELASLYQLYAWIDGFVSGTNTAKVGGPDLLASRPGSVAMYAWIDNYCQRQPLDAVVEATIALVKELEARAKRN